MCALGRGKYDSPAKPESPGHPLSPRAFLLPVGHFMFKELFGLGEIMKAVSSLAFQWLLVSISLFSQLFLVMLHSELLVSSFLLSFALATPQHGPKTGPGYVVAKPLHQMELSVYRGNASNTCQGFLALQYASPKPVNETTCVAGVSSAASLHDLTCVARKKADPQLDQCELWGYLDGKCGGVPVIAGRQAPSAPWIWGLGTGQTVDVKSFKVSC